MKLTVWGARGSVPAPGEHTVQYGGNTPCVFLEHRGSGLVLDAGSGLRNLGSAIAGSASAGAVDLLLSHVHWDHIQGVPFFAPLYSDQWQVRAYGPRPEEMPLATALEQQMAPPYFPLHFAAVARRLQVTEITADPLQIGPFEVASVLLRHPGRTFGYRIRPVAGGPSVSYLTDNELGSRAEWAGVVGFLRSTDLLVHDAMFTEAEAEARTGWGHSSLDRVVDLAVACGAARVLLFHHDPNRSDADLDRLLEHARARADQAGSSLVVDAAREGDTIEL